nr:hypothetical protein [Desertifilum tharense]
MMRFKLWFGLAIVVSSIAFSQPTSSHENPFDRENCTYKGRPLYGKVQKVERFADLKVQVVTAFPDLKVQQVNAFPDRCGQWQWVDAFPDFTAQTVEAFADLKIQYVNAFPGVP